MKSLVILAGGLGSRLGDITKQVPKPLVEVGLNKKFLDLVLESYVRADTEHIILSVCHLSDLIIERYGPSFEGIPISYSCDTELLGTGGAVREAVKLSESDDVFIANADTLIDIDSIKIFSTFSSLHTNASILCAKVQANDRYGSLTIQDGLVRSFEPRGGGGQSYVSCGLYKFSKMALTKRLQTYPLKFSFEGELLGTLSEENALNACIPDNISFIDIGVPESYERFKEQFALGLWR